MKHFIGKIVCLLLCLVLAAPLAVFADEIDSEEITTETTTETPVTFTESINLIKGKYEYLSILNYDENTKLSIISSDESIVSVNNEGKIKALKCGKATVTVKIEKGGVSSVTKIRVTVSISRNTITKVYGNKISKTGTSDDGAEVKITTPLAVKKTTDIKISNTLETDDITYSSSDKSVAKVDSEGKITAVKKGTATITATVKRGGNKITTQRVVKVVKTLSDSTITKKERNSYYGSSAFIGSSIGVGQKNYFKSKGKNYLGSPLMLVRGCYSFNNDNRNNTSYMVQYKGVSMKAKNAIKKSGVDRVFIAMGTNDLGEGLATTYKKYVAYIEGIRQVNPEVEIFIESMTAVYKSGQKGNLNSKNVAALNKKLKAYCSGKKDIYYVDVSSKMNDSSGCLKAQYTSDHYVHLTNSAYALWMKELTAYTDKLMIKQQNAEDAVKTAVESKDESQIAAAQKLVNKLDDSTLKTTLKKKLKVL